MISEQYASSEKMEIDANFIEGAFVWLWIEDQNCNVTIFVHEKAGWSISCWLYCDIPDVSRDSTPSPTSEVLSSGQLRVQQNDIPSLADRPVSPAKQEADLSTPKGVIVKYISWPEPSKKSIYVGNLPWVGVTVVCGTVRWW